MGKGVVTRFAPSNTGSLHLGSARTALFNYLYARHHGGTFLLRIEDTDQMRSTEESKREIFESLAWLGLAWDGDAVIQSERHKRHHEIVEQLLAQGKAYRCYCTPEELETMRQEAMAKGLPPLYDGRWRDSDREPPKGVEPAIRLKAKREGETVIVDRVQGTVRIDNRQLDDMVLMRSTGVPTYMLAVVVDDHDMGVTDIFRGSEHFPNAFRQAQIYDALGWKLPEMAHIPLIHAEEGGKLSKRHGATGVSSYRELGILPEALNNYLLRLGWGHGDDEIISMEQAIAWFDVGGLGKSPARFNTEKLHFLNAHYMREKSPQQAWKLAEPFLSCCAPNDPSILERIFGIMPELQKRSETLVELAQALGPYCSEEIVYDEKPSLSDAQCDLLKAFAQDLKGVSEWNTTTLEAFTRAWSSEKGVKLGDIAKPLRLVLTGKPVSPGLFDVLQAVGYEWMLQRILAFSHSREVL